MHDAHGGERATHGRGTSLVAGQGGSRARPLAVFALTGLLAGCGPIDDGPVPCTGDFCGPQLQVDHTNSSAGKTCANALTIMGTTDLPYFHLSCDWGASWDPEEEARRTGIEVVWSNVTTSAEGSASQRVVCVLGEDYGGPPAWYLAHQWEAVVQLVPGANEVRITALREATPDAQSKVEYLVVRSECPEGETCRVDAYQSACR